MRCDAVHQRPVFFALNYFAISFVINFSSFLEEVARKENHQ